MNNPYTGFLFHCSPDPKLVRHSFNWRTLGGANGASDREKDYPWNLKRAGGAGSATGRRGVDF